MAKAISHVSPTSSLRAAPVFGDRDLLSPGDFERDYRTPQNTQAIWRHTNRYGFRDLVYKVGRNVRYRRADVEKWLESRRASALVDQSGRHP